MLKNKNSMTSVIERDRDTGKTNAPWRSISMLCHKSSTKSSSRKEKRIQKREMEKRRKEQT